MLPRSRRIVPLLAAVACGCTSANPDFVGGMLDGGEPGDAPAWIADLSSRRPRDLSAPPDLYPINGPTWDVAENVLATWDVGESTNDTIEACNPVKRGKVSLAAETSAVETGAQAVRVNYGPDGSYYFQALYPKTRKAGWDLASRTGIDFWVDAEVPKNYGGWSPPGPTVVLCGANGSYRSLSPVNNHLTTTFSAYQEQRVPLAGDAEWVAVDSGSFSLTHVDSIEFHADPLRGVGTGVCHFWLDGVRFY
jgi:hypothetical protein